MNPSERRKKCSKCRRFLDDEEILCLHCSEEISSSKAYAEGKNEGYSEGYDDGFEAGRERGREEGWDKAIQGFSDELEVLIKEMKKRVFK